MDGGIEVVWGGGNSGWESVGVLARELELSQIKYFNRSSIASLRQRQNRACVEAWFNWLQAGRWVGSEGRKGEAGGGLVDYSSTVQCHVRGNTIHTVNSCDAGKKQSKRGVVLILPVIIYISCPFFFFLVICSCVSEQGSALQQHFQCSFDVHTMSNSCYSQLCKIILGQSREVRAFDFVFLKTCSVLAQIDALQPVSHVIFIPEVKGFLVEWPQG